MALLPSSKRTSPSTLRSSCCCKASSCVGSGMRALGREALALVAIVCKAFMNDLPLMKLPRNFDVTSHVEFALCGHENAELHGECYPVAKEVDRDTIQLCGTSHGGTTTFPSPFQTCCAKRRNGRSALAARAAECTVSITTAARTVAR